MVYPVRRHLICLFSPPSNPSKYIYVGFYGTSLSPIITEIIYIQHFPAPLALIFSIFVGIVMGFCLPPLATHLFYAHRGFSLYNVGFASGLIATIVVSVFKAFGLDVESREIWSSGNNTLFIIIMFGFFAILLIIGMIAERSRSVFKKYIDILKHPGLAGTDYFAEEGLGASLINMAVNGAFATLFVIIAGAQLNGPTLGGIFTIVGFSATGKHLRNIAPIMFGVWLSHTAGQLAYHRPFSHTCRPLFNDTGAYCREIRHYFRHCRRIFSMPVLH